jgi:hypothetical protein
LAVQEASKGQEATVSSQSALSEKVEAAAAKKDVYVSVKFKQD